MGGGNKYRDEKWLREQYVEKQRSTVEIAGECDCHNKTVGRWLEKHGIEARDPGSPLPDKRLTDRSWLYEQYVEKQRTTREIAKDCGCGKKAVSRWLQRNGIETRRAGPALPDQRLKDHDWLRQQYVSEKRSTYEIAEDCGCDHSTVSNWLHKHGIETRGAESQIADDRLTDPEWLREQYVEQQRSTVEIAAECGCGATTVLEWLKKHDIETRSGGHILVDERFKNQEWLREQYVEQQRSTVEIAAECECSSNAVSSWLHEHGIETRSAKDQTPDERLTDSEWLREQYIKQRRSMSDISDDCGCCKSTVRNWLKRHNIETGATEIYAPDKRLTNPEWLREQYIQQQRSRAEIAEECDCHPMTVGRWLKRHDIKVRSGTEHHLSDPRLRDADWLRERYFDDDWRRSEIAEECGCHTSTVSNWFTKHGIEDQRSGSELPDARLEDPEWMREQYIDEEIGMVGIAEECGCTASTVRRHLVSHGIETRIWPGGVTGEDHPLWNGGNQTYGDGWTESKRQAVRERDDHTCQDSRCEVTQADHLDEYGEKLHVHHLRKARDVDDAEERNAPENLITLCRDCHARWEKIADAGLVPQVNVSDTTD